MCSTAMPSTRPARNIRAVADPRWSPRRKPFRRRMMTAEYNSHESLRNSSLLIPNFFSNVLLSRRYCILSFSEVSVRFRTCGASTRPTKVLQRNEAYDDRDQLKRPALDVQHRAPQRPALDVHHRAYSVQRSKCSVRRLEFGLSI